MIGKAKVAPFTEFLQQLSVNTVACLVEVWIAQQVNAATFRSAVFIVVNSLREVGTYRKRTTRCDQGR